MRLDAAMIDNIRLRVSMEEKRVLCAAASTHGLTLSEFVRGTVLTAMALFEIEGSDGAPNKGAVA